MKKFNKIISTFNKAITDLEKLGEDNLKDHAKKESQIYKLQLAQKELSAESDQAFKVAAKIRDLVEPSE